MCVLHVELISPSLRVLRVLSPEKRRIFFRVRFARGFKVFDHAALCSASFPKLEDYYYSARRYCFIIINRVRRSYYTLYYVCVVYYNIM